MAILQRSNRSGGTVGFTRQLLIVFTVLSLVFGTPAPDSVSALFFGKKQEKLI